MVQQDSSLDELVAEFSTLADQLGMPDSERAGILGVSADAWRDWTPATPIPERRAEYQRRLLYALPLMRRSLSGG